MVGSYRPLIWTLMALLFIAVAAPLVAGLLLGGPGAMVGMWGHRGFPGQPGAVPDLEHWRWGLGFGLGVLARLAFWGFIVAGVVLFVRTVIVPMRGARARADSALDVLKRRYAAGEVDQVTYERMRQEIER
ncbi:MAG: hypothetical protein U0821_20305 [Chloroflexota bacterium]